jgi:hypothetical protein
MLLSLPRLIRSPLFITALVLILAQGVWLACWWSHPLVDHHSFRQTQTAISADYLQLRHSATYETPVLGPPWQVPFEFPLYQSAVACVKMLFNSPTDSTARVVGWISFTISALLIAGIARRLGGIALALPTFIVYTCSPFALVWGRAAMIEYTAVSLALGGGYILLRPSCTLRHYGFATLLFMFAAVVKITTFIGLGSAIGLLAAGFLLIPGPRAAPLKARILCLVWITICLGIATLAGYVWTAWADHIKSASEWSSPFTSRGLETWNFGTFAQRTNLENWKTILIRLEDLHFFSVWLIFPIVIDLAILSHLRSRTVIMTLVAAVLGVAGTIFLFFNLFLVHDYYLAAVHPLLAIISGSIIWGFWRVCRRAVSDRILALAFFAVVAVASLRSSYVWTLYDSSKPQSQIDLASALAAVTDRDAVICVRGFEWNSTIPFYAQRRAVMDHGFYQPGRLEAVADKAGVSILVEGVWIAPEQSIRNHWPYHWPIPLRNDWVRADIVANTEAELEQLRQRLNERMSSLILPAHPPSPTNMRLCSIAGQALVAIDCGEDIIIDVKPGQIVSLTAGIQPISYTSGSSDGVRLQAQWILNDGHSIPISTINIDCPAWPWQQAAHKYQFKIPLHLDQTGSMRISFDGGLGNKTEWDWPAIGSIRVLQGDP